MRCLLDEVDYSLASLETLEDEIGTLAGHLNAANYRLLALIAELDRREPWAALNCLTCAHYLNWRCGIALGAAREKVRTARALKELPRIRDAFRIGRISYSKVRALTRVATPGNEDDLLQIALSGTATHVERVVRHYRQIQAAASPARLITSRSFDSCWDDDGMLVIRGRLTAEQGAVLLKAIDEQREACDFDTDDESVAGLRADALAHVCELALAANGEARTADRYQVRVDVPAGTLAIEPPSASSSSSATIGSGEEHDDGNLGVVDVAVRLPTPEQMPVLEDHGPPLSLHTLRRLCCDASLVAVTERTDGQRITLGRKTRVVSPALRRALERRDGRCRFPGCTNGRHLDAHHIVHWAQGGETALDNLVLICRRHHRYVHDLGYQIEMRPHLEGRIHPRFFSPRGYEIEDTGERRFRGNAAALFATNDAEGIRITPDTTTPDWDGKPADYDHILWTLMTREERRSPSANAP